MEITKWFQFTPLREGRLPQDLYGLVAGEFQFTPLREGRRYERGLKMAGYGFNSRPCVRGDHNWLLKLANAGSFNSRPCVRGDEWYEKAKLLRKGFQFTPLREGRPVNTHVRR